MNTANLTFGACADKSGLDSASVFFRDHSGRCDLLLAFFYCHGLYNVREYLSFNA